MISVYHITCQAAHDPCPKKKQAARLSSLESMMQMVLARLLTTTQPAKAQLKQNQQTTFCTSTLRSLLNDHFNSFAPF